MTFLVSMVFLQTCKGVFPALRLLVCIKHHQGEVKVSDMTANMHLLFAQMH